MSRIFTLIALLLIAAAPLRADYLVRDVSGQVQLARNDKIVAVVKNMTLAPSDMVMLGTGASLNILDTKDSKIYTAATPGLYSVSRLIYDARRKARSNASSVHGKLRLTKDKAPEGVVYVEKGKVTRALTVYDPEARNIQMDIDKLASRLYLLMRDSLGQTTSQPDATVLSQHLETGGLSFMVENTLSYPIYFNVFKINGADGSVTISELGQPVGSYAILPTQFLAREQRAGLATDELHIMIMSDFFFDIDELLAGLNALIDKNEEITDTENIPIYLLPL